MKANYLYVICFALLPGLGFGQATAHITDGPYVFYRGNSIVVKSVSNKKGAYLADSLSIKIKRSRLLQVHLDGHPEWDFTVELRDRITTEPVRSPGANKIFAVSDIEGEFEPFRNLLLQAGVIDQRYHWTFGTGNLLVAGDLFDRGKQVTQYLWLLYKLEDEARAKGGAVHVVLGNHEIMNLSGDVRYVQPEYFNNCRLMKEDYKSLYGADTELGRWLRSKNVIEKDGDFLVLHGGVSAPLLQKQLSLEAINQMCRPYYAASRANIPDSLKVFFGQDALFWYRGYFLDPKASMGQVDSTLQLYKVKQIMVGHDVIDHVSLLYGGKVIGLDVDEHEGTHEGLLIEKGKYYRLDDKGNKSDL